MQRVARPVSRSEIEATVLEMIGRISLPPREAAEINLSDSLDRDLNLDSLSFIELIIELENTFNFTFDEDFLLMEVYPDIKTLIDCVMDATD